MRGRIGVLLLGVCLAVIPAQEAAAQAAAPEDVAKVHDELRALRDGLVEATNASNTDRVLSYLHKDVVVTWLNGEVSVGPEAVRGYLTRMQGGPNPIVKSFHTTPTVDALTTLYGDNTGVAYGSSRDQFELNNGMKFELQSRWTITLVKEGGRWLVAGFHASANMFDNPILDVAKKSLPRIGVIAFVVGGLVGGLGTALLRRRRTVPA